MDYDEIERFTKVIKEFPETPEGKAYFAKMAKEHEIKIGRYLRIEEWLKKNDFDKLIYRLVLEHNNEYKEKCYHNGYEPYPNRKLSLLIDYIVHNQSEVNVPELDCDFSNQIWFFKGYYLQMIYGQGVITRIVNKENMQNILSL